MILCPYVKLHPKTKQALRRFNVEYIYTGYDEFAYWETLSECWRDTSQDLIVVEQDVVPSQKAIPSMLECPRGWCTYAYFVTNRYEGVSLRGLSVDSLGCVKFSTDLRKLLPFVEKVPWTQLDVTIRNHITGYGASVVPVAGMGRPHCHGTVEHFH
jgi:hypothetical protein